DRIVLRSIVPLACHPIESEIILAAPVVIRRVIGPVGITPGLSGYPAPSAIRLFVIRRSAVLIASQPETPSPGFRQMVMDKLRFLRRGKRGQMPPESLIDPRLRSLIGIVPTQAARDADRFVIVSVHRVKDNLGLSRAGGCLQTG